MLTTKLLQGLKIALPVLALTFTTSLFAEEEKTEAAIPAVAENADSELSKLMASLETLLGDMTLGNAAKVVDAAKDHKGHEKMAKEIHAKVEAKEAEKDETEVKKLENEAKDLIEELKKEIASMDAKAKK